MDTFTVRPIHEKILRFTALCKFVRIEHIQSRFFKPTTYTSATMRLAELEKHGYLVAIKGKFVGEKYLYTLDKKGTAYLRKALGMDIKYHAFDYKDVAIINRPHLLVTNHVVIAIDKLASITPDIAIVEQRHYMTTKQKRNKSIPVPDDWVHFVKNEKHSALWIEVDRDTEEEEYIRKKVRSILEFAFGDYLSEFDVHLHAIVFMTTGNKLHVNRMVKWVERELTAMGMTDYASFFRLTCIPEGEINPAIFSEDDWFYPFHEGGTSLL